MTKRLKSSGRSIVMALIIPTIILSAGCVGVYSAQDTGMLKVMTYNIHHGEGTDGRLDLDRIARVIGEADCDIVGLQEVDNNFGRRSDYVDQAKWLAENLGMCYCYAPAIINETDSGLRCYGNAILSKYPIFESKIHKLPGSADSEPRVCLEVNIRTKAKDYCVMVTHLDHRNKDVRIQQACKILNAAVSIPMNTIFMGDFNSRYFSQEHNFKTSSTITQILTKFDDSYMVSKASYMESAEGGGRIDYVFVSNDLSDKILSNKVICDDVTAVASDHFPIVVEIRE